MDPVLTKKRADREARRMLRVFPERVRYCDLEDISSWIVLEVLERVALGYRTAGWMYRVLASKAVTSLFGEPRKNGSYHREVIGIPEGYEIADRAAEHACDTRIQLSQLQRVYSTLTPLQRAVLLRRLSGEEVGEIATALGMNHANVSRAVSVARDRVEHPERYSRVAYAEAGTYRDGRKRARADRYEAVSR